MKRGASGLSGVLAVDKPYGVTSHDVVDRIRRLTGERRVGHAGTLDPMATGVMLVGVGSATRLSKYLTGHDKSYRARFVFGVATDTDDAQGRVVDLYSSSAPGKGLELLDGLDPAQVVAGLEGRHEQLPPAYSAIKKNGVVAYKAAREGSALELEPRSIEIYRAAFVESGTVDVELGEGGVGGFRGELPYWDVELSVSKGTYIRAIARDLGAALGCGAHLGALRRTAVAGTGIEDACELSRLQDLAAAQAGYPWCDPVKLLGYPVLQLAPSQVADVENGRRLHVDRQDGASLLSCVADGKLLAIYGFDEKGCKPETVIPGGVCGVQ